MRAWFQSYNELANGVQEALGVDMPSMDLSSLQHVAYGPQRPVTPPRAPSSAGDTGSSAAPTAS
jgi:hypothetical protein